MRLHLQEINEDISAMSPVHAGDPAFNPFRVLEELDQEGNEVTQPAQPIAAPADPMSAVPDIDSPTTIPITPIPTPTSTTTTTPAQLKPPTPASLPLSDSTPATGASPPAQVALVFKLMLT